MIGSLKLSDYRCPITGVRLQVSDYRFPITANCPIIILQIDLSKIQQGMHLSHLRKL